MYKRKKVNENKIERKQKNIDKEKDRKGKIRRGRKKYNRENKGTSEVKIIHINIRGIKSKIRDIVNIAEEENIDVMVFTETKLERDEKKEIEGYKQFNLNRNTPAGGVVIFVKENIETELLKINKICETIWLKIKAKTDSLIDNWSNIQPM